jgi:hypothetical protein
MNPQAPLLARKYDPGWYEVAPLELRLAPRADRRNPFRVLKHNFLDAESSYPLDYFRHSDENLDLACINNHITSAYAAAAAQNQGLAAAVDHSVFSNFAFCPMKQSYEAKYKRLSLRLNPFGTYFGPQYAQPTWGNRQGYQAAILSGQQYQSSAPTYNGFAHQFSLMLAFFNDADMPQAVKRDLIAFAYSPIVISAEGESDAPRPSPFYNELTAPPGFLAVVGDRGLVFQWEQARGNPLKYRVHLGLAAGRYDETYETTDTTLILEDYAAGQQYFAVLEAVGQDGRAGPRTREISFIAERPQPVSGPQLPLWLQLKILGSGLLALIE